MPWFHCLFLLHQRHMQLLPLLIFFNVVVLPLAVEKGVQIAVAAVVGTIALIMTIANSKTIVTIAHMFTMNLVLLQHLIIMIHALDSLCVMVLITLLFISTLFHLDPCSARSICSFFNPIPSFSNPQFVS